MFGFDEKPTSKAVGTHVKITRASIDPNIIKPLWEKYGLPAGSQTARTRAGLHLAV